MQRVRLILAALTVATMVSLPIGVQAASGFADPAFQAQWQQGEAITKNFWGPLETAKDGQQEPYKEAGGNRLVQYFDKGRMELTNGKVTNGLLATEIVKGQIQTGDSTFQNQAPPNIAIAGDATNTAPTYAGLSGKASSLLQTANSAIGSPVTATIGADGGLSTGSGGSDPAMTLGAFDDATKHNVAAAFVDYRNKAGLATIGLAISEPFLANVKVGGAPKDVMVQVFERRVLTYTASNPDAFKVEMGNIGAHYFAWRYPNGATAAPATTAPATTSPPAQTKIPTGFIEMAVLDGWKVDQSSTRTVIKMIGPTPSEMFTITQIPQPSPQSTPENEVTAYTTAVHKAVSKFADERTGSIQLGGELAKVYSFAGTRPDNSQVSGIFVAVFHNGKEYTFEALADAYVSDGRNFASLPDYSDVSRMLGTVSFT